jgi:hypothetical protein
MTDLDVAKEALLHTVEVTKRKSLRIDPIYTIYTLKELDLMRQRIEEARQIAEAHLGRERTEA